jgi:hypothetical protein
MKPKTICSLMLCVCTSLYFVVFRASRRFSVEADLPQSRRTFLGRRYSADNFSWKLLQAQQLEGIFVSDRSKGKLLFDNNPSLTMFHSKIRAYMSYKTVQFLNLRSSNFPSTIVRTVGLLTAPIALSNASLGFGQMR